MLRRDTALASIGMNAQTSLLATSSRRTASWVPYHSSQSFWIREFPSGPAPGGIGCVPQVPIANSGYEVTELGGKLVDPRSRCVPVIAARSPRSVCRRHVAPPPRIPFLRLNEVYTVVGTEALALVSLR